MMLTISSNNNESWRQKITPIHISDESPLNKKNRLSMRAKFANHIECEVCVCVYALKAVLHCTINRYDLLYYSSGTNMFDIFGYFCVNHSMF